VPGKVLIPVIVEDSRHRPINGLTASSLIFSEHKTALTEVSLLPATELPLELGIAIDASGSEQGRHLQDVLTTVLKFAQEMVRGPEDRVFFLRFNVTSEITPWLKQEQLANFILRVDIGGGTALHDAVATACRERLGPRDWNKPTRRVLVVFSDGEDNQSHLTHGEASLDALKSGAMMFTLTQEIHPDGARGDRNMRDWAMITGGRFFSSLSRKDAPPGLRADSGAIGQHVHSQLCASRFDEQNSPD
jgi:Ca-activated chloride channel family protein